MAVPPAETERQPYDEFDKKVVRATQGDLPIVSQPFAPAAEALGISEASLLEHLEGMVERRTRLGRHGRSVVLTRFQALPGGAVGRWLERAGARELPLLLAVLRGRVSFVGPRMVEPGTGSGHTGPRRLMAPGLIGPAQLRGGDADTALSVEITKIGVLWHCRRVPLPLEGRG